MAKVVMSPDCGNSPKNLLVQALVIAIETSHRTAFSRLVSDELTWALPSRRGFDGKAAALASGLTRGFCHVGVLARDSRKQP